MSRLERVYLANVVLYFKSFSDVKRFKLVNKKCYDSVEMLHIYSCKSIHSTKTKPSDSIQKKSFDEWVNSFIPEDLFEVQPNTETITLSAIDQCVHSQSVIKKVKRVIALDGAICDFPDIKSKIVSLHLTSAQSTMNLSQMQFLRRVVLTSIGLRYIHFNELFPNTKQKLDFFKVVRLALTNVRQLEKYKNFATKVVVVSFSELSNREQIRKIGKFANIVFETMNASTLKKGVVEFEKGKLTFDCKTSKMRYKRIEKLYLPSKITLFGVSGHAKVNMSAFGQLTSLECLCDAYCVLKNLMHLIEFTLKGKADTVPASVEQLILKENATIDIIPKENNVIRLFTESRFVGVAAFTQLEKLKLARLEIPPLEMLTKLTALDLFQCFYHAGVSFPSSLKSLHIEKMALDDHFIKMASQNCCLSEMKLVDSVLWENSLNRFNVEKLFYSGSSTPLLPTSIKTLELWTLDTRIDISSLSNLKQLALNNACSNSFVFPKHIKTLIIGICDRIDNFENLRIDNLYISFPHQLEEWANQWVTTLRTDTSFNVTNVAKLFPNLRKESGEW